MTVPQGYPIDANLHPHLTVFLQVNTVTVSICRQCCSLQLDYIMQLAPNEGTFPNLLTLGSNWILQMIPHGLNTLPRDWTINVVTDVLTLRLYL